MTTDDDPDKPDTAPEESPEHGNSRLVAQVRVAMEGVGGRVYQVQLERLDRNSLLELIRCFRDIEYAKDSAVRRVRLTPWRR